MQRPLILTVGITASALLSTTLSVASLQAQSAPAAATTLEIPTLVVDHNHRPVGDLKAEQFKIKIDDREPVTPTTVHIEGKEPIALMVLLDASRDSYHDLARIGDELAGLTPDFLLPTDTVSVYAADCHMVRSLYNAVPGADNLRKAVADALGHTTLHDGKSGSACGKSFHLWDDVAAAVLALSKLPGRRVLLVVSSGQDGASKYDWKTVQDYAFSQDVAIFGLRDQRQADADNFTSNQLSTSRGTGAGNTISSGSMGRDANFFELLCANAGGLILNFEPLLRKETLAYFLFIVRNRFILTVPADLYPTGHEHRVKVLVPTFFVSPAGVAPPLQP